MKADDKTDDKTDEKKLLKPGSDPLNVVIVRPFSRLVSTRLARTSVTPNQVTLAAFASALVACFLTVNDFTFFGAVAAAFFIQLYIILDCADGELARLKGVQSAFGKWFDGIVDTVATGALLFAFGVRASASWGFPAILLSFAAALGFFTANFSYQYGKLVFAKKKDATKKTAASQGGSLNPVSIAKSFSPGAQMLLLALGALASLHFAALALFALWANAVWIGRLAKYYSKRDKL